MRLPTLRISMGISIPEPLPRKMGLRSSYEKFVINIDFGRAGGKESMYHVAPEPFPYSIQSMRNYIYNRNVTPLGVTSLTTALDLIVDGVITDFVYEHQFDYLTSPQFGIDLAKKSAESFKHKPLKVVFIIWGSNCYGSILVILM